MINKKVRDGIIIFLCVLAVILTAVLYSVFATNHIYNESKAHLTEIYYQAETGFSQRIELTRKMLKSWRQYIDDSINDINSGNAQTRVEFNKFTEEQIAQFDFSTCYFIGDEIEDADKDDYRYKVQAKTITIDGEGNAVSDNVTIRVRRSVDGLLVNDTCGVVGFYDGNDEGVPEFLMFAVDTTENTYEGFKYHAIGVSFNTGDIDALLDVKTFGQSGICYVTLADGQILAHSGGKSSVMGNYLEFLKSDECELTYKTAEEIESDWMAQRSGACLMVRSDVEYYLTYMPVEFGDWMLLGIAPTETVNSSMSWFRTVTLIVMVAIFVVVGAVVATVIILNSRRKVAESLLEVKSRDRLLDLLSLDSTDIFVMFSPDTFEADYVSSNVEQVLGISQDELRGDVRKILAAAVDEYKPFTTEVLKSMPKGNTMEADARLQNVKTKEIYWFKIELYHSVVNGKDNCVLVFSDRTEDKKMREQLEEALGLAKNANEAKSNFLSNMSHDIRTPMNAIIGYATLLAKDADDSERVRDYTHKIMYSGQHLLSLINDILDMSKIESGKTSLYIEQFSLPEFIEELYSMMVAQANAKKQSFEVHTKGKIPEHVLGDKMRLNQILLNIISNAVKYTPAGGKISLNVEMLQQNVHNHAHLKFTIQDNGIGMSEQFVKSIFEPFSRETTAVTKTIQGTGLGMAITKNIVDLMGGVITVDSSLGKGSTFTVELELAMAEVEPDDIDFWAHHNVSRVLVVDDDEDVCKDIQELMADTGVEVDYRLNGRDAVKAVEQSVANKQEYNIVVIDWKMPDMDGLETARRLRKKVGRELPIMVLTSFSFEDIEGDAKEAGVDLLLSKPFFVSNFRRAVMQINANGTGAETAPVADDISIEGLTVLAAEDNEINVEILTELLDIEGVKCDIAYNGKEALEMFAASPPDKYDIIFMDVQMPIMDGHEAARAIRACSHDRAKTIPIIAMTANAFDDDVKAALESGMNAHLAKPIDMAKLKQLVVKLVPQKEN